jgi:hypothetical protein
VTLEIIHYQAGLRLPANETIEIYALNQWQAERLAVSSYIAEHPHSSCEVEVKRVSLAMDREHYYEFHESKDELTEMPKGDYGRGRF